MIEALFGSKTRVKLLHLFFNHPGESFYVREITRKIDEQINSVRRELSNMMVIGIVTCDSSDNKLYYGVNQRYKYYVPLRAIFSENQVNDDAMSGVNSKMSVNDYKSVLSEIPGVRIAIFSGVLCPGSNASVDVIMAGDNLSASKTRSFIKMIEKHEARDINYTVLSYEDFYYRLSVKDKFISEILNDKHHVAVDTDNILKNKE